GRTPAVRPWDLLLVPLFLAVMTCYGLYRRGRRRLVGSSFPDISHLAHSLIVAGVLSLVAGAGLAKITGYRSPDAWEMATVGVFGLILVTQARAVARFLERRGESAGSRVLIVGSGVVAGHVLARLATLRGVDIVGWVDDDLLPGPKSDMVGISRLGGLDELAQVVSNWNVDHVVVAFSPAGGSTLAGLLRELSAVARISVVPRLFDLLSVRSHVDDLRGLPVVDVAPPALGPADRFAKRVLDVLVAGAGLLVLLPVMAVITLAVKTTSPGPVFFSQERTGRHRRPFRIHKFRTMTANAEDDKAGIWNDVDGPLFKSRRDPRITSVGRFLRRTSLDEIPQLFNVLKGEMSLVGPRPFVPGESREINGWASRRFDVRPGMTGLWQVSGRNDLPFDELCRLDYSYVASWSFWWDLHILWQTPAWVFRSDGAY
ncbi:MAG TPA: sugar transferase, partial [Acidimicrobiales bacterium]|nr:sugar transferase [Acidimicrobiales bacterium]